jgi:hypothetical protein
MIIKWSARINFLLDRLYVLYLSIIHVYILVSWHLPLYMLDRIMILLTRDVLVSLSCQKRLTVPYKVEAQTT